MKKSFVFICILSLCSFLLSGCQSYNKFPQNINKYNIIASFNEESKVLTAEQNVKYVNSSNTTLNCVMFNLYPNVFSEGVKNSPVSLSSYTKAYPNGASYGNITIKEVMVNEVYSSFTIEGEDKTFLKIPLNKALYPDECVNIFISFEDVLPNVLHRYGYGENTYNFGNFYPIACVYNNGWECNPYTSNGDPFYSEVSNYDVKLTINSDFIIAHTGNQVKKEYIGKSTKYSISAQAVRDFAFVISKEFSIIAATYENVEVKYFYFNDENYKTSLQAGIDSIKTFNKLFGEYPYSTLHIVQSNFIHGGMEYPNLIYIQQCNKHFRVFKCDNTRNCSSMVVWSRRQ